MQKLVLICLMFMLAACQKPSPVDLTPTAQVAQATLRNSSPDQLCAAVDSYWNQDWAVVIAALETLVAQGIDCRPDHPSAGKLYAAHFNYGALLENNDQPVAARDQYYAALYYRPDGREARDGLNRLDAQTPTPPPLKPCPTPEPLNDYQPSPMRDFVQVEGKQFMIGDAVFTPRGINYFPANFPWRRFLPEADLASITADFDRLRETGFNTLRIFLWYDALFICRGASPNVQTFQKLDKIIQSAADQDFRLIITLNDLPDLTVYHLYDDPLYVQEQTRFIVERYRHEAAILAWDLRNEGDIDYDRDLAQRDKVYRWLESVSDLVRLYDPDHLITAGWLSEAIETEPYVDFLSFHHWTSADSLAEKVRGLHFHADKPVLLEEFGYSTYLLDEGEQNLLIREAIEAAEREGAVGWLVWAAYDFPLDATCIPPACPSTDNAEHHFGLWHSDGTPKPIVKVITNLLNK